MTSASRDSSPLICINQTQFEWLRGEFGFRLRLRDHSTNKLLPTFYQVLHFFFNGSEHLGSECLGDIKFVVEAIFDGGPMPNLAAGINFCAA